MDEDEARFFRDLVAFAQASLDTERNEAFERISSSQRFRAARHLDQSMFEYLSRWYHPVVREMVSRPDFQEDPAWISQQLFPSISKEEATASLELLLELGLLEHADGKLRRAENTWSTGHEVRSLAISNYHRQMMTRAMESIESVDREWRHLSAITGCISSAKVPELKQRIQSFREMIIHLLEETDDFPEHVYQLNIQLFPLTRPEQEPCDEA